jgi:hypothetical protein
MLASTLTDSGVAYFQAHGWVRLEHPKKHVGSPEPSSPCFTGKGSIFRTYFPRDFPRNLWLSWPTHPKFDERV